MQWPVLIDAELLDSLVARAAQRRPGVMLLEGPFGAGATTLAEAVRDRLRDEGAEVLSAYASPELRDIPLGAMAPIFGGLEAAPGDSLTRLLATLTPASAAPVLIVDDAANLDDVSAAALRQLVRSYGVRAVLTARTGALLPDAIARLDDEGLVQRIPLPPLTTEVAAALVEQALGERVDADSLRALIARAQGVPRLLRGLLQAAVDAGGVRPSPTGLVIDRVPVPARLALGMTTGYDALGVEARELAELLAVGGRLPVPAMRNSGALPLLAAAGLVRVDEAAASIVHPLHAEALVARLAPERGDRLRVTAAALLAASGTDDDRYASIVLLADSSSAPSTPEVMWAAEHANITHARASAVRLAELALALAEHRCEARPHGALLVRADALSHSGLLDDADAAFAVAVGEAQGDELLAETAVRAGFHYTVRRRRPDTAVVVSEQALERLTDPTARAYVSTNVAKWQLLTGQASAPSPVELPEQHDDPALVLSPLLYRLLASLFAGDLDAARATIAAGRPLAEAARPVVRHGTELLDFGEYFVLFFDGRIGDALAFAQRVHPDPSDEAAGMWAYGVALACYHQGRYDEALRLAATATEQLATRDFLGALGAAIGLHASAAARLGLVDLGRRIAADLDEDGRRFTTADLQVAEAEAWMSAAAGDVDAAIARLTSAVQAGMRAGYGALAALTASVATRLGHPGLALSMPTVEAPIAHLLAAYAAAVEAGDATALLGAAQALEAGGLTATAHDAAGQSEAIARRDGAAALTRQAAGTRLRIAAGFSPAPSPGGPEALLSPRELAVSRLAADRVRNREIADQLGLSLRTVENHLANSYRKLGVTGRDDLRERLS